MSEKPPSGFNEQAKNRFVFLEIGGYGEHNGGVDLSLLNRLNLEKERDPLYLNIDVEPKHLGMESRHTNTPAAAVLRGDLTDQAFLQDHELDASADRIVAFNVLSLLTSGSEDTSHIKNVIQKIARTLKPKGQALVGEWFTAQWAKELLHLDYSTLGLHMEQVSDIKKIKEALAKFGITKPRIENIIKQITNPSYRIAGTPFLLLLTRAEGSSSV